MVIKKSDPRQLYNYIDSISKNISSEAVLSQVLGYTILFALSEYKAQRYGRQPKSHREMQAVYESLEKLKNSYISSSDFDYEQLSLRINTKNSLTTYLENSFKPESHLLESIFKKNPQLDQKLDALALSIGRNVIIRVQKMGELLNARNRVWSTDYNTLEEVLNSVDK